ncbi:MAG: hypothetical protein ABJA67_18045 [Chthonomonadales bacterium]
MRSITVTINDDDTYEAQVVGEISAALMGSILTDAIINGMDQLVAKLGDMAEDGMPSIPSMIREQAFLLHIPLKRIAITEANAKKSQKMPYVCGPDGRPVVGSA